MTAPSLSPGARAASSERRAIERSRLIVECLLPAVERLLEADTYPSLTVERIIGEARISRSTFYKYFDDKTDLLRALLAEVMADIVGATQGLWELTPEASPEDLRVALSRVFTTYRPHGVLMRAVADTASHDPAIDREFLAQVGSGIVQNTAYIRAGQQAGRFRSDIDAEVVAEWLTWMVERALAQTTRGDAELDAERSLQAVVDVFWKAVH